MLQYMYNILDVVGGYMLQQGVNQFLHLADIFEEKKHFMLHYNAFL